MTPDVEARLWPKIVAGQGGCWIWTGALSDGYGQIWAVGRTRYVHRVTYEHFVGEIEDGLTLDHLCRVRNCANPAHLEPVTVKENILRGESFSARNRRATHCPAGHEYDLLNTRWRADGRGRDCRACLRDYERRRVRDRRKVAA